jgi:branched-subunit amino acid transport protein AzlD
MTLTNHALVIIALVATSLVVRIVPAFIRLQLTPTAKSITERALPMAVFVNFTVYLMWIEISAMAAAAIVSILIAAIATFFTRAGLMITTCASTIVYAVMTTAWPT